MPALRLPATPALLLACLLWPAAEAAAQQGQRPKKIGEFQDWTAAAHAEGGQKVCYAFTRATKSEGVPNRAANKALLVVTHRPKGRDQVALQPGYAYPRDSGGGDPVQVSVGGKTLGFFTSGSSAFARDNKAALSAFRGGRRAVARGPLPSGGRGQASDSFSLSGFTAAHEAISRECPASGSASPSASRR